MTFFFLWIATQFDIRTENYLAYFFILSFGMLHGSNDIKLVGSIQNIPKFNFWMVLIFYVGVVSLAFTVFMLFPKLGLLFFILISGYHFGEQHLEGKLILSKFMTFSFYTLYGLLIFSMIFLYALCICVWNCSRYLWHFPQWKVLPVLCGKSICNSGSFHLAASFPWKKSYPI